MTTTMNKDDEQVLGVMKDVAIKAGVREGFSADSESLDRMDGWLFGKMFFQRRGDCETNESFLQLIPYVAVVKPAQNRVLTYSRSPTTGEERLIGRRSIGIGGHVNPEDVTSPNIVKSIVRAAERELDEELPGLDHSTLRHRGFLYDPSDAVGRVHLGVVFVTTVLLGAPDRPVSEDSLHDAKFRSVDDLIAYELEDFESWSKILLTGMRKFF